MKLGSRMESVKVENGYFSTQVYFFSSSSWGEKFESGSSGFSVHTGVN